MIKSFDLFLGCSTLLLNQLLIIGYTTTLNSSFDVCKVLYAFYVLTDVFIFTFLLTTTVLLFCPVYDKMFSRNLSKNLTTTSKNLVKIYEKYQST